jgi:hypothetical protein
LNSFVGDDVPRASPQLKDQSDEEMGNTCVDAASSSEQPSSSQASSSTDIVSNSDPSDYGNRLQIDSLSGSTRRTLEASFTCNKCGVLLRMNWSAVLTVQRK